MPRIKATTSYSKENRIIYLLGLFQIDWSSKAKL